MAAVDKINVLLVDDQPAKLLAYETILQDLGETLIKASSAKEALQWLLKIDVAVLLIDVCMPELDGFELAAMIREHPRFQRTAIIFVSAIHLSDIDRLRGYQMGAVDYVPVPVIPEVLRAKVRIFAELYRKTRQLEQLNADLERRVAERTAELEASNHRLRESEQGRSLALAAGRMGSWEWDPGSDELVWDAGQYRIFDLDPAARPIKFADVRSFIHPEDLARVEDLVRNPGSGTFQTEVRILRPDGQTRWCICAAAMQSDALERVKRVSGVTIDITELREAEARRMLLAREVDHRARNALAVVQSIIHLTKASSIEVYAALVEGRVRALSNVHALLAEARWEGTTLDRIIDEELAPYHSADTKRIVASGPQVLLKPETAQIIALVLHELATNSVKYGSLSRPTGQVSLAWQWQQGLLEVAWKERGGPPLRRPTVKGYGTKAIEAGVVRQLGGSATFDWRRSGLEFAMSIVVQNGGAAEPRAASAAAPPDRHAEQAEGANAPAGERRVLLVEDEALVAMMMSDLLVELGYDVSGPFAKISEATAAMHQEQFMAAVLDVSLSGETIYGLAEQLIGRGVPIVFVTGYGSDAIDARFARIPMLQKPVDKSALERVLKARQGTDAAASGSVSPTQRPRSAAAPLAP